MTFGYVTWTEPQLSIADEIKIADQVRAHGTEPWTSKTFSDQSGQLIWMASVTIVFGIIAAFIDENVVMPLLITMGCVCFFYFMSVAWAVSKQERWLRRLEKKHPAGSKPPPPPKGSCAHCGGQGSVEVLLSNNGGTFLSSCPRCHGSGRG